MDIEQENMQLLGLFGIYKESYKMIFSWRKIFSQITLVLILPPTFILFFHIEESHNLLLKISHDFGILTATPGGIVTPEHLTFRELIFSSWSFFLSKLPFFIIVLIFTILSTSSVVYTVASIYSGKALTFKKVLISCTPKIWKKLMLTYLGIFTTFFIYDVLATLVLGQVISRVRVSLISFILILSCFVGLVYLSVVWPFASVVTVLEESYGYGAMMKSMKLTKGKMGLSIIIDLKLKFLFLLIEIFFVTVVVNLLKLFSLDSMEEIACRIVCFMLLSHLALLMLVTKSLKLCCILFASPTTTKLYIDMDPYDTLKATFVCVRALIKCEY